MESHHAERICIAALVSVLNAIAITATDSLEWSSDLMITKANVPLAYGISFLCWILMSKSDIVSLAIFEHITGLWMCLSPLLQVIVWLGILHMMQKFPFIRLAGVGFLSCRGFNFIFSNNKKKKAMELNVSQSHHNDKTITISPTSTKTNEELAIPSVSVVHKSAQIMPMFPPTEETFPKFQLMQQQIFKSQLQDRDTIHNVVKGIPKQASIPKVFVTSEGSVAPFESKSDVKHTSLGSTTHLHTSDMSEISQDNESVTQKEQSLDGYEEEPRYNKRRFDQMTELVIVDPSKRLLLDKGKSTMLLLGYAQPTELSVTRRTVGRPQLKRKAPTQLSAIEAKLLINYLDETFDTVPKRFKSTNSSTKDTAIQLPSPPQLPVFPNAVGVNNSSVSSISNSTPSDNSTSHDSTVVSASFIFGNSSSTSSTASTTAANPQLVTTGPPMFTFGVPDNSSNSANTVSNTTTVDKTNDEKKVVPLSLDFTFGSSGNVPPPGKSPLPTGKPPTPSSHQAAKSVAFGIAFSEKSVANTTNSGFGFGTDSNGSSTAKSASTSSSLTAPAPFTTIESGISSAADKVEKPFFSFTSQGPSSTISSNTTVPSFTFGGQATTSAIPSATVSVSSESKAAPAFTFGGQATTNVTPSATVSASSESKAAPAFTFGGSSSDTKTASSFSFNPVSTSTAPAATATPNKDVFSTSFSGSSFSFGGSNSNSNQLVGTSLTASASSLPSSNFTFGQSSSVSSASPASFGLPSTIPISNAPTAFGSTAVLSKPSVGFPLAAAAPAFGNVPSNPFASSGSAAFGGTDSGGGFVLGPSSNSGKRKGRIGKK